MPTVFIPAQMRDLTGGLAQVQAEGATLRQVIAALEAAHPGLAARLCRDDALTPGLAAAIDGVVTSRGLRTPVGPQSEIHFMPAIGGG